MNEHTPQVASSHYRFAHYSGLDRWVSYHSQLRETLAFNPESVLEVGVGERVFGNYLRSNTPIAYTSVDVDPLRTPDHVASVTALPFQDRAFDLAVAFEVLEHIPFSEFETALQELRRVSRKGVILSLPHFGPPLQFHCKIPLLPALSFSVKIPYRKVHVWNGEHYWELGTRGYSLARIRSILEQQFTIAKDFVPYGSQYHHFFVLTPRAS